MRKLLFFLIRLVAILPLVLGHPRVGHHIKQCDLACQDNLPSDHFRRDLAARRPGGGSGEGGGDGARPRPPTTFRRNGKSYRYNHIKSTPSYALQRSRTVVEVDDEDARPGDTVRKSTETRYKVGFDKSDPGGGATVRHLKSEFQTAEKTKYVEYRGRETYDVTVEKVRTTTDRWTEAQEQFSQSTSDGARLPFVAETQSGKTIFMISPEEGQRRSEIGRQFFSADKDNRVFTPVTARIYDNTQSAIDPPEVSVPLGTRPPQKILGKTKVMSKAEYERYLRRYGSNNKKIKRADAIQIIDNDENSSITSGNNTDNNSAEFEQYLGAYEAAQSNASDVIFPFLDRILAGTNNSLVYDAAWSVWAELTGAPIQVVGPFMFGLNCLDWIEESWMNSTRYRTASANGTASTNGTASANGTANVNGTMFTRPTAHDMAMMEYLAIARVVLELYEYAYYNGTAALNETGVLEAMDRLGGNLLPVDESVATPGFGEYSNSSDVDFSYFTIYNETMDQPLFDPDTL